MRKRASLHAMTMALGLLASSAGASFDQCLRELGDRARQEGVSAQTVDESLERVRFRERVVELDRRQPEFTESFATYLERRITEQRVQRGRALLAEHRDLLEDIAHEYGVPPQYLVAFWGMETSYGGFFGNTPVLDALATLACDGRRGEFFSGEFINALRILEEGAVSPEAMEGSWAGAMGHMQFMPSVFLRYAVDHDGSGRRDLWNSVPDAMASAANFLRGIGWERGLRWGREVRLPDGFPYEKAGRDNRMSLSRWAELEVTRADGNALPEVDVEAALLVPAGHRGPAFLVYENFDVIMRWNRSEFYALAVGHLADRINGAGVLHQPPPEAPRLSRSDVKELQRRLNEKGHDSGEVDGVPGPNTRTAIARFQREAGMVADGFADYDVLESLGIEPEGDEA